MNELLKNYFENMFVNIDKNIKLDNDQINAILNDDKYVLVLAGAGTGKTTTMAAKVKYLVDIKKINPEKILVISYTKKAVEELREIINYKFKINSDVTTFHSLAYKYVRKIFSNRKCKIVDYNEKETIFLDYINKLFKENKISNLIETFNESTVKDFFYGKFFEKNYKKYPDYNSLFNAYKKIKLNEANQYGIDKIINEWVDKWLNNETILTIKGDVVKSVSEGIIANFLFKNGINYEYERVYDRIVQDRKIYRPDFTLDLAGQKVYLEYFGLNNAEYIKNKKKKIEYHLNNHEKFIYLENLKLNEIENELDKLLKKERFVYYKKTGGEIYEQILDNNKLSLVFKLKNLFYNSINQIKENVNRAEYKKIIEKYINNLHNIDEKKQCIAQYKYIKDFYHFYASKLYGSQIYGFDYSDLIYYSNKYILQKKFLNEAKYDYVIIDEYQDISDGEYTLARNTSNLSNSNVFAVGDDWQSIYSFRGSNISYIIKFNQFFENPTILTIRNTYRNSQELVNISKAFIEENSSQLQKELISIKHINRPICFIKYDDRVKNKYGDFIKDENGNYEIDETIEYKYLKELILRIHKARPNHKILILGRTNKIIEQCFKFDSDFKDGIGTKIVLNFNKDINIDGMTVHKSKGLTYDEVILIGMNSKFPMEDFKKFWIVDLFEPKKYKENIDFSEERRILYVALTRTKNHVFILKNDNPKNRSFFVDELISICENQNV